MDVRNPAGSIGKCRVATIAALRLATGGAVAHELMGSRWRGPALPGRGRTATAERSFDRATHRVTLRATHRLIRDGGLEWIPFSGEGSVLTETGSKPENPRGLKPAARDAISRDALT